MAETIGRVMSIILLTSLVTLSVPARGGPTELPEEGASSSLSPERTLAVQTEVKALLTRQVDAWNRGDLQAFMDAYWDSPDLMFFLNGRMLRGREQIATTMRDRYKQAMGRLVFGEPHFGVTNADAAVFWGEWRLGAAERTRASWFGHCGRQKDRWRMANRSRSFELRLASDRSAGSPCVGRSPTA